MEAAHKRATIYLEAGLHKALRLKAELNRIAPAGTPRHFVVNTGAEAVENAIKAVLMNRVLSSDERDGGFVVSFEGAFHGRTLGALAVTHRKRARLIGIANHHTA